MEGYRSIHAEHFDSRLEDFVQSAQRRIRTARLAKASLQGLTAASMVFLLSEIARAALAHFGVGSPLSTDARLISAYVAAAVLVVWIALAVVSTVLFAPDRPRVARLADRQLQLDERLSTALEIRAADRRSGLDSLLGAAVVIDAQTHIRTLDPDALARPWLSAWALAIPVAIVVALLVPVAGAMLPQSEAPAAVSSQLSDEEKAQVEQSLQQMAELTMSDAAAKKSAYLGAVARTADALRSQVADGSLSRQQVSQTLGQLMSQASGAYRDTPEQTQRSEAEQTLSRQLLALQAPPAHPQILDKMPLSPHPAGQPLQQASQQPPARPPQPNVNNPEKPSVSLKDPPRSHLGNGYDQAFSTFQQPRQSLAGAQMTLTEQQQVEAAENAYSGGVTPGDGTRPLGGGSGADGGLDNLLARDSAQLALPPPGGNEGERISIKAAPPTQTAPADAYTANRSDAWTGTPDQAVARHESHAWEREILTRYFRPDQDDQ